MASSSVLKSSVLFCCEICEYNTCRKSQYTRHLLTPKHNNASIGYILASENVPKKFICECGKEYKHDSSYSLIEFNKTKEFKKTKEFNVTKEFNYFGKEFEEVLSNVFKTDNLDIKCNLLDNFFLSKLVNFKHSVLIDCLNMIIESNGTIKVETLVETTGINRKTLLRHFQKHFCCSIEEYKKMVKFRNTLNFTQSQLEFNSLTEISQ